MLWLDGSLKAVQTGCGQLPVVRVIELASWQTKAESLGAARQGSELSFADRSLIPRSWLFGTSARAAVCTTARNNHKISIQGLGYC
jgi:hypothetical protein